MSFVETVTEYTEAGSSEVLVEVRATLIETSKAATQ
jgi:hypothetical protein